MRFAIETISPQRAAELLQGNFDNRKLDKAKVKQWASEMSQGRWRLTSQPIAIAADGRVVDGQHRLHACVDSGVTIQTAIAYDADPSTFGVIDVGKTRTGNDIWGLAGMSAPNVAAIAKVVYLYFEHSEILDWQNHGRVPNDRILDWCKTMEACEIIRKAAHLEQKFRKDIKGLSSVVGASLAIYAIEGGVPLETTWEKVYDRLLKMVGMSEGEPVYALSRIINKRDTTTSIREGNPFRTKNNSGPNVARTRLSVLLRVIADQLNGKERVQYALTDGQTLIVPSVALDKELAA